MRIAFLGTGNMGLPMARNLAQAGHALTAWNRTRERAAALEGAGVKIASTAREAAADAEVAVTMLADDRALEQVAAEITGALPPGAVHCGMSTVSPAISRRLAAVHAACGQSYVAAPVFGRPEAAAARKLWVVAAGAAEAVERCRPVFDAVGRGFTVAGKDPQAANVVKLAGNMTIAAVVETLGEAYTLMRRSGIEPAQFLEVIDNALYQSPLYANYGRIIAQRRFDPPGFRLRLGLKDVKLLLEAAEEREVALPLASLIRDRMLAAIARGGGELDWTAFSTEG
ncbi:MAG: NAD(P)-dependent oxidoreductase [Bryobacteraceae bacterium]